MSSNIFTCKIIHPCLIIAPVYMHNLICFKNIKLLHQCPLLIPNTSCPNKAVNLINQAQHLPPCYHCSLRLFLMDTFSKQHCLLKLEVMHTRCEWLFEWKFQIDLFKERFIVCLTGSFKYWCKEFSQVLVFVNILGSIFSYEIYIILVWNVVSTHSRGKTVI